jgi:hypothetical protein
LPLAGQSLPIAIMIAENFLPEYVGEFRGLAISRKINGLRLIH